MPETLSKLLLIEPLTVAVRNSDARPNEAARALLNEHHPTELHIGNEYAESKVAELSRDARDDEATEAANCRPAILADGTASDPIASCRHGSSSCCSRITPRLSGRAKRAAVCPVRLEALVGHHAHGHRVLPSSPSFLSLVHAA